MPRESLYRGQWIHLQASPLVWLLLPFVQLKRFLKLLYDFLARLIWRELTKGEKYDNEWFNLLVLAIFCLLSWLSYLGEEHTHLIFLISLLVWSMDWGWAIASYSHPQHQVYAQLSEGETGDLIWQIRYPQRPRSEVTLDRLSLTELRLERQRLTAGAFAHPVGEPWQLSLLAQEDEQYILDQAPDLDTLLPKAKHLSDRLHLPLHFAESYGNNPYAASPLDNFISTNTPRSPAILLRQGSKQWRIVSQWRWGHSLRLLAQILKESGFFLFLSFLANYMNQFGGFIHGLIIARSEEPMVIDPIGGLLPRWDWGKGIDIALLVGIILYNGWKMSQIKRVQVDRHFVKYGINAKAIAQLRTERIQALLLLGHDNPELLILTDKKALSLGHFAQRIESITFLEFLAESIRYFREDDSSDVPKVGT